MLGHVYIKIKERKGNNFFAPSELTPLYTGNVLNLQGILTT